MDGHIDVLLQLGMGKIVIPQHLDTGKIIKLWQQSSSPPPVIYIGRIIREQKEHRLQIIVLNTGIQFCNSHFFCFISGVLFLQGLDINNTAGKR